MGLSAAMYSGTTGLKVHGEDMTVVGNNIANVSTVGYKASRMYFEDALSQTINTAAGVGQVGRGASIGAVYGDFSQGSIESTTEATDLAIGGNGFFVVSPAGEEINYYTRAGNFRFNEDGYLVDPHGYRVQGWEVQKSASTMNLDNTGGNVEIVGVPKDVKMENFQSPPQATTRADFILNLDSRALDKSSADGDAPSATPYDGQPFTALFDAYDADADFEKPFEPERSAYQSTIKVYDQNGTAHNLTVYMDPVLDPDVTDNAGGKSYWEYIITVPPGEDNREFWSDQTDQSKRGLLMAGTMTFNAAGELENMSAFTINNPYVAGSEPSSTPPYTAGTIDPNASAMTNWTPANLSQNGYPMLTANFLGAANASITKTDDDPSTSIPAMDRTLDDNKPDTIEINFGLRNRADTWTAASTPVQNLADLQQLVNNMQGTYATPQEALAAITGLTDVEVSALSTTNYASGSTTIFQSQDGYTAGFLQNISVDRDGIITGRYSNGQVMELFALTLATFNNNYGLYREGGNLFSETRSSGPALTGMANTGDKGSISSNSLEQSNVDLATEFVRMITTEKGFQANSKTITTVDQMLTTLIQIKR